MTDAKQNKEQVEAIIQIELEKMKKLNQDSWNLTVQAAEKVFNEKGIAETLELLP